MPPPYKIAIIGHSKAGKTSLVNRMAFNEWTPDPDSTAGATSTPMHHTLNGKEISLNIWDSPSRTDIQTTLMLHNHTSAILLIIPLRDDIDEKYLEEIYTQYLEPINQNSTDGNHRSELVIIVSKADSLSTIPENRNAKIETTKNSIKAFLVKNRYPEATPIHFVSAATGENIPEMISDVLQGCIQRENLALLQKIKDKLRDTGAGLAIPPEKKEAALEYLNEQLDSDLDLEVLKRLYYFIAAARKDPRSPVRYLCQERNNILRFFDPAKGKTTTWTKMLDALACAIAKKSPVNDNQSTAGIIRTNHHRCALSSLFSTPAQRVLEQSGVNRAMQASQ